MELKRFQVTIEPLNYHSYKERFGKRISIRIDFEDRPSIGLQREYIGDDFTSFWDWCWDWMKATLDGELKKLKAI